MPALASSLQKSEGEWSGFLHQIYPRSALAWVHQFKKLSANTFKHGSFTIPVVPAIKPGRWANDDYRTSSVSYLE
ncbi:hypothetical protein AY605_00370 [Acinetobacter sp. SFD]|uniref:hypothetical protein n=1 Tax=Acinetobacter sp. SFD TaxID=1805635 RepID=UPI0007D073D3|nr:hypothetical protein [Acinetobacter sp. SFD]OAL86843.1 hypothetical protein AY605_00370 [Acinetobacter sp. SFD]